MLPLHDPMNVGLFEEFHTGSKLVGRPPSYAAKSGLKVNVAVAQNPDAAIHAAKCFSGVIVIAPGQEATRLGDLPIEALDFTLARVEAARAEILETLELWGIRRFRDFAELPEAGVSERLDPFRS